MVERGALQGLHVAGVFQHGGLLLADLQHADVLVALQLRVTLQYLVGEVHLLAAGGHFAFQMGQFARGGIQLRAQAQLLHGQLSQLRALGGLQALCAVIQALLDGGVGVAVGQSGAGHRHHRQHLSALYLPAFVGIQPADHAGGGGQHRRQTLGRHQFPVTVERRV